MRNKEFPFLVLLSFLLWFIGYFGVYLIATFTFTIPLKLGYFISATLCALLILILFYKISKYVLKPIWLLIAVVVAVILIYFGMQSSGSSFIRALSIDLGLILVSISIGSLLIQSLHQPSYIIPIAIFGAALDIWSGFLGPTKGLVTTGEINYFLFRFPLLGTTDIPGFFGVSDLIFCAFYLNAVDKFRFDRFKNLIILQSAFMLVFLAVLITDIAIPVLPFLSLGFILSNWKKFEERGDQQQSAMSFIMRKRQWILATGLILLLLSVPILKWYSQYQIKYKLNSLDTLAKKSIDMVFDQYQNIIQTQTNLLLTYAKNTEFFRSKGVALPKYSTRSEPEMQVYQVALFHDGTYRIENTHPETFPTPDWKTLFSNIPAASIVAQNTGTVVIPNNGLQILSYLRTTSNNIRSDSEKFIIVYFPLTTSLLKKKIAELHQVPPSTELAVTSRSNYPEAIDEWETVDASIKLINDGNELPFFTDRELNLSFLDRAKYFFYQHIGAEPYKICATALPFSTRDSLLCVMMPYPIQEINELDNYTKISTSVIFLFATILVVLLVLHRGLKLTKKFVFALALATLLPIVIFRYAGFSTRDELEERISRHVSDGLLRAQKIVKHLNYIMQQAAVDLTKIESKEQAEEIIGPALRQYPQLQWVVNISKDNHILKMFGTAPFLNSIPGTDNHLMILESNPPQIWFIKKYSDYQPGRTITTTVGIPFDQKLLNRFKINSGAQTSLVWNNENIISTLPRIEAESLRISEAELAAEDILDMESFTVTRLQISDMAYTVGYLRLPIYTHSTTTDNHVSHPAPALLAIALPRTFVDQQIREFDDNLMSFTILMLLVASFIGLGLTMMTMQPLIKLIRGTQEVGNGNLDYQVTIRQKDEMGELGKSFNQMVRLLKDRQRIRETFSKYVSERVAEKILSHPEGVPLQGERRAIAILYADIRGFTAMAEQGEPEKVVTTLNECFTYLIDTIFKYEGTLDKFMGDCVMALFGAPIAFEDSLDRAIYTALEMQEQMVQFNQHHQLAGRPAIQIGIGINFGEVIIGNVGSQKRLEYTAIGDNVNIAFRLQEIADGGQILVTEECFAMVDKKFTGYPIGPITAKGKANPITVVQITGIRN